MQHVLDMPERTDAPEARAAGDVALVAALSLAAVVVTVAAASVLGRAPAARAPATGVSARRLPFVSAVDGGAAWRGTTAGESGVLTVAARDANGAVATVEGGEAWRDYTLRVRARWVSGRAVSFHVRDTSAGDFVACVLDGSTARIDEVSHGVARTLASAPAPAYRGRAFDAVVVVTGRRVSFSADGATLVSASLAEANSGTAGIGTWDPAWGRGRIEAEYVRVEPVAVPASSTKPPAGALPSAERMGSGE